VYDDFKKDLFSHQYTEEEWNADINFIIDCTQFYLSTLDLSVKIQPPMGNVIARNLRAVMTDMFLDWAQVYFHADSENCNKAISRDQAMTDFANTTKQQKWMTPKFSKALKAFCRYTDYVMCLNPEELKNSSGRIIRKVAGKSTEMIYVQTRETLNASDYDTSRQPEEHRQPEENKPQSKIPF
jgi:hypothetical protein